MHLQTDGHLPPGIHAVSLAEVCATFGSANEVRRHFAGLLQAIVSAAVKYPTMKRVLVWGSFASQKADLDYSVVVSVDHARIDVAAEHSRYFVPHEARRQLGVDAGFLILRDYPLEYYIERLDFMCRRQDGLPRGILEISLRGEAVAGRP